MKLNKLLTVLCAATPIVGVACFTTSCQKPKSPEVEPTYETAEEYIKDRTFAIATIDNQGEWAKGGSAGTCWILADASPTNASDYVYWIATNWHVKNSIYGTTIGYRCDGVSGTKYTKFASIDWNAENEFYYPSGVKTDAIDFYIAKANFASAEMPSVVKDKLDKLNDMQEKKGYINKFLSSSSNDNWCHNNLHCGGYPAKKPSGDIVQEWHFENIDPNLTKFRYKGYDYMGIGMAGHPVDGDDDTPPTIWDQSPNYEHSTAFYSIYNEELGEQYIPVNWSLSGGASGSMLITAHDGEWCVVGIYWGGWESGWGTKGDVKYCYFYPAFSLFKSSNKNFVADYEPKTK